MLLYADESEALTHPYLARAWAKRGADLRVPAPGQAKKVAMMGALDWLQRKLIVATSRTDLKAFNLAHKTFTDVDTLDAAIHSAVADLNTERNRDLLGKQRISA